MAIQKDPELHPIEVDTSAPAHHGEESRGLSPVIKILVVFTLLGGALSLLMFGSQASDALVYSKLVHEVLNKPDDFRGRELRVEGDWKQGSIKFRESPCEYRFVL